MTKNKKKPPQPLKDAHFSSDSEVRGQRANNSPDPQGVTPTTRRSLWPLTAQQQPSEQLVVAGRGVAVPAVVPELVLALGQPVPGAGADGLHHLGVLAAQLPLLVDQAGDVVAHHLGAQRAHVPADRRRGGELTAGTVSEGGEGDAQFGKFSPVLFCCPFFP